MPGLTLGIGETNPKQGAIQFDARRIDGVKFVIPTGAGVLSAPVGSIVTLQEDTAKRQIIVLGAAAYKDNEYDTYNIIGIGFLEAATQVNSQIDQTVGVYATGDFVSMISDVSAVAAVPMLSGYEPLAGGVSYITPAGELTLTSSQNVAFPGYVWFGTPGLQNSGQLKTGYCFARLGAVMLGVL